ncbi:MAG: type III secretion system gatekeeper subunit SctW [Kiritimatiellia bacterium]
MMDSAQIMRQALSAGRFDALQNSAFSTQQTNQATVESGQAMGFRLETMSDPLQELQDSMEELSFSFEEKTMKSVAERKMGEMRRAGNPFVEAVLKWQKVLPDMPGGAFMERMLRNLRQAMMQGQMFNSDGLKRMLGEGSSDPSVQFAMLEAMEEGLSANEAELKNLIAQTKQALNAEKGAEIRAGLNIAEQINAQAKAPEEMQGLRDLYRQEVLGFKNPQDCFRSLLASRGAGKLGESLDFLTKSCGLDLHSPSPSQSPEELRRVLGDLQCVNVLKAILDKMGVLAGKMQSQFGETCLLNGEKLTGRILDFTEMPFVNSSNIASLISSCGLEKLLAQLYFCTELIGAFRQLSPRLFAEESDRFKLEDAAQEHLDGLVSLQEEAEKKERDKRGAA